MAAGLVVALASGACSLSVPVLSGGKAAADDIATQSVAAKPASLSSDLGPEDWRRAKSALALAVDPQGNGSAVSWDNPESAMRGSFTPIGKPFVRNDEICRLFLASIVGQAAVTSLQGTACRLSGGEWSVSEVKPWKKPA